eukprot:CAMPEP_0176226198 /NCGR_PEP_ID=MMETSP0121_2-20121125/22141_1 /TAXON_ID=160619 /ORGANISM="Kryptoperidinium foliaceum, Strain CCMP 1326" /LENGTH=215 /DNA_ID=CAMNT_0017565465 /DNA_START=79 /DNA_END=727 /DNA_ORIENTATION=+
MPVFGAGDLGGVHVAAATSASAQRNIAIVSCLPCAAALEFFAYMFLVGQGILPWSLLAVAVNFVLMIVLNLTYCVCMVRLLWGDGASSTTPRDTAESRRAWLDSAIPVAPYRAPGTDGDEAAAACAWRPWLWGSSAAASLAGTPSTARVSMDGGSAPPSRRSSARFAGRTPPTPAPARARSERTPHRAKPVARPRARARYGPRRCTSRAAAPDAL